MILNRWKSTDLDEEKGDDVLVWMKRSRLYHSFDQSYEWIRRSSLRRSCKVEVDPENHFQFYEKQRSSFLPNQRKTNLACRSCSIADFRGMCCWGDGTIVFVATELAGRVSVFDSSAFVSWSWINERRSWLILEAIRRLKTSTRFDSRFTVSNESCWCRQHTECTDMEGDFDRRVRSHVRCC